LLLLHLGHATGHMGCRWIKRRESARILCGSSQDDVSGYEDGTKAVYTGSVNANRYCSPTKMQDIIQRRTHLLQQLTSQAQLFCRLLSLCRTRLDQRRINNINQHFVTAFPGHLPEAKRFWEIPGAA